MADTVLIIDDDKGVLQSLEAVFLSLNYQVVTAESGAVGLLQQRKHSPQAVVLDRILPGENSLEVLAHLKTHDPDLPILILTGDATVEEAVEMMQAGASSFLLKSDEPEEIVFVLQKLISRRQQQATARNVHTMGGAHSYHSRKSDLSQQVFAMLEVLAENDVTVLLEGESGTGKTMFASLIHSHSSRVQGPFIEINCAGLSEDLLESELFGHEKGAFTGAVARKRGLFEVADSGTIFLDEIAEAPAGIQAKLLKVLDSNSFRRVGGVEDILADVRIIAATNADLEQRVKEKTFRLDLFHRLSVFPVRMPALRETREDIVALAEHFLLQAGRQHKKASLSFERTGKDALARYDWPGNIRELKNVIERAVILARDGKVTSKELLLRGASGDPDESYGFPVQDMPSLDQIEKAYLEHVLNIVGDNKSEASRILGLPRNTLYARLKKYGISL